MYRVQFYVFVVFNMMQDILFVLTRLSSQKSKLVPVARLNMFLPIITSRELLDAHLES
jgi:hypothetical protein